MTTRKTLDEKVARIKQVLNDSARGPLIASALVMEIVNNWRLYEAEAQGKDSAEWVRETFGKTKAYFAHRYEASKALKKEGVAVWHHDAAVWVYKRFYDTPEWKTVMSLAMTMHLAPSNGKRAIERAHLISVLKSQPQFKNVLSKAKIVRTLCPECKARIDDDKKLHEENQSLKILLREKAAQIASDAKELAELRAKDKAWKLYADHFVTTVDQFGTPASLAKAKVRTAAEGEFGAPFQESKM